MKNYIVCFAFMALIVSGCGKDIAEKALENQIEQETGQKAEVDLSEDSVNIRGETEEGEFSYTSGEDVEVPDNFPADILVYEPSKVLSTINVPEGQSLVLSTSDEFGKVLETYKQKMTAQGWSEEGSINMGQQSMLMYKKGDRSSQIRIVPSDEGTQIVLVAGED